MYMLHQSVIDTCDQPDKVVIILLELRYRLSSVCKSAWLLICKLSEVALRNITEKISSHLTGILQFTEQIEPSKKTIQHLKLGFTTDQQPDTR